MKIGDVDRVGRVVRETMARDMSMADADVTRSAIRLWLHEYGETQIVANPVVVAEFLVALSSIAGSEDAMWWLRRLEQAHPEADPELAALIEGVWSELHVYNGESADAIRHGRAGLALLGGRPPNKGLLPLMRAPLLRAQIQAGDLDGARRTLDDAGRHITGNAVVDEVRIPAWTAYVDAVEGHLGRAIQIAGEVERRAGGLGLGAREPGRIFAALAKFAAHLEREEHASAATALEHAKLSADASHRLPMQSLVALHRARFARALGNQEEAGAFLLQSTVLLANPDADVLQVFAREGVEQALRFEPSRAAELIDSLDQERTETKLLRTRQLLLDGNRAGAAEVFASLPPATTPRSAVERDVLHALTRLDIDVEDANGHMIEALVTSRPQRIIRAITTQGPDVHKLLVSCTPGSQLQTYVEELTAIVGNTVAPVRTDLNRTLIEPLSAREITVLRYLCSRLTNEEIAAALFVSLNTLKSHLKSVYRKLGVSSRAEAVNVGRALRVI